VPGSPLKPPELRQGHRIRPALAVVSRHQAAPQPAPAVPDPPPGLLKATRVRWAAFWTSPQAAAALPSDLGGLERWIISLDEWTRAMRAFRKERIVEGSTKQPALNPLAAYIASREAAIRDAEEKYGMTPMARLRLGIAVGQAKLTAAELNRALAADDGPILESGESDDGNSDEADDADGSNDDGDEWHAA
jgi:hypothetical protein